MSKVNVDMNLIPSFIYMNWNELELNFFLSVKIYFATSFLFHLSDTPPSSLMDSTVSLKVTTMEGEGVGGHSLAHNTSRVEGCARALGWGLERLTNKSITHMDLHKPNNKLVSA